MQPCGVEVAKGLGVPGVHATKAAKLPLNSIPVAMVVDVFGREFAPREGIDHLRAEHHLHGER